MVFILLSLAKFSVQKVTVWFHSTTQHNRPLINLKRSGKPHPIILLKWYVYYTTIRCAVVLQGHSIKPNVHETWAMMIDFVIHHYKAPVKAASHVSFILFIFSHTHTQHRDLNIAGTQSTYQLISWTYCSHLVWFSWDELYTLHTNTYGHFACSLSVWQRD